MKRRKYRSIPKLVKNSHPHAGRNNSGHITVRHRGGGHKKNGHKIGSQYQINKGIVVGFEYNTQRTVPVRKTYHTDQTFSYQPRSAKIKAFDTLNESTPIKEGFVKTINSFQPGDFVHSIELYTGQGPVVGRAAGSFCQIRSNYRLKTNYKEIDTKKSYVKVRLPSGQDRLIPSLAKGIYGIPAKNNYDQKKLRKAGQNR